MKFGKLNGQKKRGFVQRTIAFLSILAVIFSSMPPVNAAGTTEVSYYVTYGQTEARSMLSALNKWRTGNTWYWNSDDATKTTIGAGERGALVYSNALEKAAMQRAAELVLAYSHSRPNGDMYYMIYDEDNRYVGENIAYGYKSAESVLKAWIEEDKDYSGQGHRRNMLNEHFGYIGIGHVKYEGLDFWVQELGEVRDYSGLMPANDSNAEVTVEVKDSTAVRTMKLSNDEYALSLNQSVSLPTAEPCIRTKCTKKFDGIVLSNIQVNWKSSDESVVQIIGSSIKAVDIGVARLTASADILGRTVEKTVYVTVTEGNYTNTTSNENSGTVRSSENSKTSGNSGSTTTTSGSSGNQYSSNGSNDNDDDDDDDYNDETTSSSAESIMLPSDDGTKNLSYQVTNKKKKTVAFTKVSKKATAVTVPATIQYNNKEYKVTGIKSNAFKGRSKIKNISLDAKNIRSVGDEAFKGIKKNAKITISAKTKKKYRKVVKMIKESDTGKVRYVYKKK